jgi:anti-sigma B factor antagonist
MTSGAHLTIQVRNVNDVTILDLKGRLIMGEPVDSLKKRIAELLASGRHNLAINLAGLSYVDSSGISSMIEASSMAKKAGTDCKFFAATKRVLQLLRIARLDTTIVMHADEASVLLNY